MFNTVPKALISQITKPPFHSRMKSIDGQEIDPNLELYKPIYRSQREVEPVLKIFNITQTPEV